MEPPAPSDAWKDTWKLGTPGHAQLRELHEKLRAQLHSRWNRSVPLADELLDRWEKAAFLGFGEGTSIYDQSLVLGNVKVGKNTWIGPGTVLDGRGGLTIGDYCSISAGVQIYSHDTVMWSLSGGQSPEERSPTSIGSCTYIGPLSVISRGVQIGSRCVVGTHSFVKQNLPDNSIAVGCPARIVGRVEIDAQQKIRLVYAT